MLIATKVTKKNKLYIYSSIIVVMFGGGFFSIYNNYISNLELIAPAIPTPAISKASVLDIGNSEVDQDSKSGEKIYKTNKLIDLDILNDPKFRSLKKNVAIPISSSPGKRNPFQP